MARINGIPTNGAIAYKEGVMAGECPYIEDDPDFNRWNEEWDQAADEHEEMVARPKGKGSVITNRYRANYSERGHPTHCGDELALILNELCSNKAGTNIELFEAICSVNNVYLGKYNRTTKGWQGRLRMTGRNLLAKKVVANGGRLILPEFLGEDRYLSEDWIRQAEQKFKPKTEQLWTLEKSA